MPAKYPLRRKTILLFVGFTMLVGMLFSAGSFLIAFVVEDELIDRLLTQEISYLQQPENAGMSPRLNYFSVHQTTTTLPAEVINILQEVPETREIFTADQAHYHIRQFHLAGKPYYLLAEVSALLTVSQQSEQISLVMLYISLFAIALAGWIAFNIANYTSRPLVQLSNELAGYKPADQQIKLSAAGQHNEIGYLANAIQTSMNELNHALQRESEFTRDVSHELRTPMTVLNNLLQLAQQRGWQADDAPEMRQQLQLMQQVIEVLLVVARQQHISCHKILLLPIIEEAVLEQGMLLDTAQIEPVFVVPETLEVQGNAQVVRLLFKILLENTARHGLKGQVTFSYTKYQLRIENPLQENNIIKAGIGLRLAEKMANSMGWHIQYGSSSSHFLIVLSLV